MACANPMAVRFAHDSISFRFRAGDMIDEVIDRALAHGVQVMDSFPPMELVCNSGKLYSISNRRLFVFRALAHYGILQQVPVVIYGMDAPRINNLGYDPRWKRTATKWERSFTTLCDGVYVKVQSAHWESHRSPALENDASGFSMASPFGQLL